jgi:hypothetical protein
MPSDKPIPSPDSLPKSEGEKGEERRVEKSEKHASRQPYATEVDDREAETRQHEATPHKGDENRQRRRGAPG